MSMATTITANPKTFNVGVVPPNDLAEQREDKVSSVTKRFAGFNAANPEEESDRFASRRAIPAINVERLLREADRYFELPNVNTPKILSDVITPKSTGSQAINAIPDNSRKPLMTFELTGVPFLQKNFSEQLRQQLDALAAQIRTHAISDIKIDGYGFCRLYGKIRAEQVNHYLSSRIPPSFAPDTTGHSQDEDKKRADHNTVTVRIYSLFPPSSDVPKA